MSKLGKKIISVPKDSKVAIQGNSVTVTGPKGTEKILFNEKVFVVFSIASSNPYVKSSCSLTGRPLKDTIELDVESAIFLASDTIDVYIKIIFKYYGDII